MKSFQKNQFGIGPMWRIVEEMGQKWILEPLFSEIQLNIEQYSNLKQLSTRVYVAKWLQCLGQICLAFEKFEESQVQFPSQEDDFFFFVQINYYKLFIYACILYNDKMQSKALGNLSKITINF